MMSLRTAINEKCRECTYDPADRGTWRQQVGACTVSSCPLHLVRPMPASPLSPSEKAPNRAHPEQEAAA